MHTAVLPEWVEQDRIRKEKEAERWERRGLDTELNRWGKYVEARLPREGYPSMDNLNRHIHGAGSGAGHRILCDDMPPHIYAVHGRVIRLPAFEQYCIWLKFVFRTKDDGTLWELEEKCRLIGQPLSDVKSALSSARNRILGITD